MTGGAIGSRPVRVPEVRSLSEAVRLVVYVFLLSMPFLVYVALSARQVSLEYKLSSLVSKRQDLSREHERLALKRAALLSPSQVDRVATSLLGMVPEDPQEPVLPEGAP
jgi:cell division protein FtsL